MLGRLLLLALLTTAASVTGAAGSPVGTDNPGPTRVGSVTVADGPNDWTAVADGRPAIDFNRNGVAGLAANTRVVIGDPDAPVADHAFALTNEGDEPAAVRIGYAYDRRPPATAGVSATLVDASGRTLGRGAGTTGPSATLAPGETAYVVVTIDTAGTTAQDDLSGRLSFDVTGS